MTASSASPSALAVLASYLIGAIPFGYWLALRLKGVDVRKEGSGNIGATNVARVIGFRFFWPVFLFDMAKGLLPTWGFPRLVAELTGQPPPPDLAVLVGLASILGHNYPVYLKFKGGKGVATSLGVMLALDPYASAATLVGFVVFLLVTRYVSLSSLLAGGVFFLAHFQHVDAPWAREQRAMTILTVGLNVLLLVRHRKNLARIGQGTEPKVSLRKKRNRPAGRISPILLVALAVVSAIAAFGAALWSKSSTREVLQVGRYTFAEVARAATGHQRAERVAFADSGKVLAVTCPRYDRLVLYTVTQAERLKPLADVALDGKPVAVAAAPDRLHVLIRPPGDRRHVEPGWWETFDFLGQPIGRKVTVGFYPDDMALSPDGKLAFVLTSGRAEGGADRPSPGLDVYEVRGDVKPIGRLEFEGPTDDPSRLTLSTTGKCAVVTLFGSSTVAAVDLFGPRSPRLIGRTPLAEADSPYPSRTSDDTIVMPVSSGAEAVILPLSGFGDCMATTMPQGSALGLVHPREPRFLGCLTLKGGSFNLAKTRPTGLAYSPDRNLIAVANRSGGVHLVAVRVDVEAVAAR